MKNVKEKKGKKSGMEREPVVMMENKSMNKKVFGLLGLKAFMAGQNMDFLGMPKTTSAGDVYASDKSLKYAMKKIMQEDGEKIIYMKSHKITKVTEINKEDKFILQPKTLAESYNDSFQDSPEIDNSTDTRIVLKNLFTAVDIKNFGATFAVPNNNAGITGVVQIGQGMNVYEDSQIVEQTILSPFRHKEDATASTLGTKIVSDEAHYFFPLSVNPNALRDFIDLGMTEGYTEEDYKLFKEMALVAVSAYDTNSKKGCDNELAIFIEGDLKLRMPNVTEYAKFEKGLKGNKNTISFNCNSWVQHLLPRIHCIEIYYNPDTTIFVTDLIDKITFYDIRTSKEL